MITEISVEARVSPVRRELHPRPRICHEINEIREIHEIRKISETREIDY